MNLILEKCRKKVGFYMVAKISINLANKCIIYPEHNITDYRVDNMFIIKSFDSYIPNICLEIDEDCHNDREKTKEIARENFIKIFGHKIIRVSVRRNESNEEVDKLIIKTTKDIELLIVDLLSMTRLVSLKGTSSSMFPSSRYLIVINSFF
jgi:very-short-patch-repair endonuclease